MKYTVEEIKGMSDDEIESAIHSLFVKHIKNNSGEMIGVQCRQFRNYLSDWSVTGPLMVEYGIDLCSSYYESGFAVKKEWTHPNSYHELAKSNNKNPLRAICEVILMMESGK